MDTHEIISLYENGESLSYISKIFNITTQRVKNILIENNVHIRSRSEQTRLTNMKRAKKVDDNYFSNIDNINKAWLLGFLAADGYVAKKTNSISIGISSVDEEILMKIKDEIQSDRFIGKKETNNGFKVSTLQWSSYQQKKDLEKFGIVNRKTYKKMCLPHFENNDYIYAFILGFFDGDGSFTVLQNKYCRFRLCAHREELLKDISLFLEKNNIKSTISKDSRGLYELSVSTKYAVKLLSYLYDLNSICLDRKKQKFYSFLENNKTTSL